MTVSSLKEVDETYNPAIIESENQVRENLKVVVNEWVTTQFRKPSLAFSLVVHKSKLRICSRFVILTFMDNCSLDSLLLRVPCWVDMCWFVRLVVEYSMASQFHWDLLAMYKWRHGLWKEIRCKTHNNIMKLCTTQRFLVYLVY